MKKLIEALLSPKSPRKVRESFAFQKKPTDKLSAKDRALLELLAGEIEAKDDEAS